MTGKGAGVVSARQLPLNERLRLDADWLDVRAAIVLERKAYHLAIEYQEVAADLREAADRLEEE